MELEVSQWGGSEHREGRGTVPAGSQIKGLHSVRLWMRWELLWTVILTTTRDCLLFISKEVRDLQTVQGLTGVPKIFCILFPVTWYLRLHLQVHSLPLLARKNLISKPFTECFPGSSACSALEFTASEEVWTGKVSSVHEQINTEGALLVSELYLQWAVVVTTPLMLVGASRTAQRGRCRNTQRFLRQLPGIYFTDLSVRPSSCSKCFPAGNLCRDSDGITCLFPVWLRTSGVIWWQYLMVDCCIELGVCWEFNILFKAVFNCLAK